jgi:8-oxo-dGTP pyrophosphatase MutT (NUDIX family)
MSRAPIPTWCFALVVVRKGRRFLVVRERSHGQRWYLPAGRVEPGERLVDGAVRETREESGVPVVLEGIVRIQHTPGIGGSRLRVIFVARPADDTAPGPTADSLDARWVTLEELSALPLRGGEVAAILAHVAAGGPIYPLSLLSSESSSW